MNAPTIPPVSPLLKADPKVVLTFSAEKGGLMRVTYQNWDDAKTFKLGEWVKVVAEEGQMRVYRMGDLLTGPT
jgi:hypothetical protein